MPRDLAADERAFIICRDIARRTGGDFYLSTFFLPRAKRDAVHAIFAFLNLVAESIKVTETDSPAPSPSTVGAACCSGNSLEGRINLLRQRIDHLYASPDAVPYAPDRGGDQAVAYAFARTIQRHPVPKDYLEDLIEGCRIEATASRFATWKSVDRLLSLRWGSLALAFAAVVGLTSTDARQPVIDLGKAVGLTKLLRDLPKQIATGRVPLPVEDLAISGHSERDLLAGKQNDQYHDLIRFETARARHLFTSGRLSIPWLAGDGSRLMAATIATLYDRSLDRLTPLSTWQRVRLLPTIWTTARA